MQQQLIEWELVCPPKHFFRFLGVIPCAPLLRLTVLGLLEVQMGLPQAHSGTVLEEVSPSAVQGTLCLHGCCLFSWRVPRSCWDAGIGLVRRFCHSLSLALFLWTECEMRQTNMYHRSVIHRSQQTAWWALIPCQSVKILARVTWEGSEQLLKLNILRSTDQVHFTKVLKKCLMKRALSYSSCYFVHPGRVRQFQITGEKAHCYSCVKGGKWDCSSKHRHISLASIPGKIYKDT